MKHLPTPEQLSSYFDERFTPLLGAMSLRWPDDPEFTRASLWQLPENVRLVDTPPEQFGVRILRTGDDAYEVYLRWNRLALHWPGVRRHDLLKSSLREVLASLGTDLGHLLEQPVLASLQRAA